MQRLLFSISPTATGTLGAVQNTCAYTYGDTNWKDKMTAFGGKAIEYDVIGNPTKYDGWTFVWQAGRQLKEMTKDSRYARFSYDHDGMRTRKQTESGRTDYYWSGKRLLELKVGDDVLHMYYDAAGKPAAVSYGNSRYRYVYNLQGDVVALIDAGQAAVVEYRYDAWGKLLATTGSMAGTLGKLNPFRYRGYIYDEETGLYWLRSRYYNPEWKRFVNADSTDVLTADPMGLAGKNLFAYCDNNPVVRIDSNGKKAYAIGGVFSAAFFIGASYSTGYCWDDKGNFGAYYTYVGLPHNQKWPREEATVSMGGMSASIGFTYQEYPNISIKELAGHGTFYGMGVDTMGYSFGVDGLNTASAFDEYAQIFRENRPLDGIQYSWNLGVGWELAHTGTSFTYIMLILDEGKYIPSWKRKLQSAFE